MHAENTKWLVPSGKVAESFDTGQTDQFGAQFPLTSARHSEEFQQTIRKAHTYSWLETRESKRAIIAEHANATLHFKQTPFGALKMASGFCKSLGGLLRKTGRKRSDQRTHKPVIRIQVSTTRGHLNSDRVNMPVSSAIEKPLNVSRVDEALHTHWS